MASVNWLSRADHGDRNLLNRHIGLCVLMWVSVTVCYLALNGKNYLV